MIIFAFSLLILGIFFILLPFGYQMIGLVFLFAALLCFLSNHKKIVITLFSIAISSILFLEIPILRASHTDAPDNVDYLILLGAGVNGTTPSLSLLDRLEAATEYLQSHPNCKVIVSGGQGTGEDITEAEAMENYLIKQNISIERIIQENQAKNTYENISFSYNIIKKETTDNPIIAVVSSEYHLYRAKYIANELGYTTYGIAAPTSNFLLKINYFLREALAVIKMWIT